MPLELRMTTSPPSVSTGGPPTPEQCVVAAVSIRKYSSRRSPVCWVAKTSSGTLRRFSFSCANGHPVRLQVTPLLIVGHKYTAHGALPVVLCLMCEAKSSMIFYFLKFADFTQLHRKKC